MKRNALLSNRSALNIRIPGETVPVVPLVEIWGNTRVLVENHLGITSYSCSVITISSKCNSICVRGRHLEITSMSKHRIIITGIIETVDLIKGR